MFGKVKQVVLDSGLWDDGRAASHGFLLSPSVYEVSRDKKDQLEALGAALHDCLGGLGRIAAIAARPDLCHSATWGVIARALRTGVPVVYHDFMTTRPGSAPSICKVDLMESGDGELRIAEIDGHNKHGLGYSTLAARIRRAVSPEADAFPGVANMLAKEVARRGETSVALLYADQERFYTPEFRIFQSELAEHGIETVVIAESDVHVNGNGRFTCPDGRQHTLLVDLPFLHHNTALNALLVEQYRAGDIDFLIPPKPFLGSKAVLALLRNDLGNEELESILKSQIPAASLELVRRYIPTTYLVHKRETPDYWRARCEGKRFVLKESISSGMKGTIFSDDPRFADAMSTACGSYYRYVLQEEVINRPRSFDHFGKDGSVHHGEWFMRVTVHYAARRVADIAVTARQDKRVHGALDCLQLGAIVV
ncbi:MAG: hypothetical protein AAB416_03745 [Patescibacteria group bacterium]